MSDLSDFSDTDFDKPDPSPGLRSQLSKSVKNLKSLSSGGTRKNGDDKSGAGKSAGSKTTSMLKKLSKKPQDDKTQTTRQSSVEDEPNETASAAKGQKRRSTELEKLSSSALKDTATGVLSPPDFVFSSIVHDGQVFRPRTDHLVVELNNTIYIWGGQEGNTVLDEMIKFMPGSNSFTRVDPTGATPPAVIGATLVARRLTAGASPVLTLFGGIDSSRQHSNETWNFYPEKLKWENERTSATPSSRRGHSMCVGAQGKSLYLWGGLNDDGVQNDGYVLKGKKWDSLAQSGVVPPGRCFHSATMAAVEDGSDAMFVFGGDLSGKSRPTNELWIYRVQRKSWELVENATGQPPVPRFKHAAAFYDGRIWISGGRTAGWFSTYAVSDFFVYDVAANCWFQCDLAAKELGYHANFGAMALVPRNKALYIFGGSDYYGDATSGVYRLAPVCTTVSVRDLKQDLEETTTELGQLRSKVQTSISEAERVNKLAGSIEQNVTESLARINEATKTVDKLDKELSEAIEKSLKGQEVIKQYEQRMEQIEAKLKAMSQLGTKFEIMETSVQDMLLKLEEKADQSSVKAVASKVENLAGEVPKVS